MAAIDLQAELTKIIEKQSIESLFQPIFNISAGKIHGFEALSRGPVHSPLYSPVPLFKTAEHEGRLSELETLCRQIAAGRFAERKLPGKLFINISPKALLDPDHPKGKTLTMLQQLGISPSQVVIELSEQHPADDIDLLKTCLLHYRNQGFLTAIDDLGAGYSGLRLWSELAPDYVKIDRHFIHQIDKHPVKQEFVRSIVELCQSLTCKVIAEGIETEAELQVLRQLGIIYCQGFLLGRPETNPDKHLPQGLSPQPNMGQATHRYIETAESLACGAVTVPTDTKLKSISDRFSSQPALQAVVVVDGDTPLGLISRTALLELFSTPYGRALHENHCVIEVMDTRVPQFDASEALSSVSQLLTSESDQLMAQQFLILRQGKLIGVGHTKDLLARITEHRIKVARHANPLTGLPGNVPIQEELQRLKQQSRPFYLVYFDLSHFKPYNDIYGFCRGDEVICHVASLLSGHQDADCFVGHIGGDDFVMITTDDPEYKVAGILKDFEAEKRSFFQEAHWQAQCISAEDRQGAISLQPLTSLCAGILSPRHTFNATEHELSALSARAKKQAKLTDSGLCLLGSTPPQLRQA
ncbi:bifunctional diguanylate cyclase/phosphodiesterase [Shewanella zhangzhouensis]|uniref:bifunctional diguanylate cyclase/phosphodiesterase n=1 Tax=Shewanella zhangzhouensis TaxID=2864213 RepID=UPI001C660974|nr:bifunctional diguanylate cyclase/phosphodiesterase [Shewanella zhangzhouensis]QYK04773.1 EAL and GGDEF domain-containing protein [Shewanella zhangzhouensis]